MSIDPQNREIVTYVPCTCQRRDPPPQGCQFCEGSCVLTVTKNDAGELHVSQGIHDDLQLFPPRRLTAVIVVPRLTKDEDTDTIQQPSDKATADKRKLARAEGLIGWV